MAARGVGSPQRGGIGGAFPSAVGHHQEVLIALPKGCGGQAIQEARVQGKLRSLAGMKGRANSRVACFSHRPPHLQDVPHKRADLDGENRPSLPHVNRKEAAAFWFPWQSVRNMTFRQCAMAALKRDPGAGAVSVSVNGVNGLVPQHE
jgi:hypothetical protein